MKYLDKNLINIIYDQLKIKLKELYKDLDLGQGSLLDIKLRGISLSFYLFIYNYFFIGSDNTFYISRSDKIACRISTLNIVYDFLHYYEVIFCGFGLSSTILDGMKVKFTVKYPSVDILDISLRGILKTQTF